LAWTDALLEFWFEFASTYSYPVAMGLEERVASAGIEVKWKPFLLGPLFAKQGWTDSPFNLYPAKGAYMWRDLERICHDANLEWRRPSRFPQSGLLAARIAYANEAEEWVASFVRAIFVANFAREQDISDPSIVMECVSPFVSDPRAILDGAQLPATKDGLRARTADAENLGIFGSPSFVVEGELFWGGDRLEQAIRRATRHVD
jgi:2-hydroxychromene-2-carboxylate isomerase